MTAATPSAPASVVIIDDTPDIRLLLSVALNRHPAFRVVGEAADGRAGIDLVAELRPDAAVLDIAMPTLDGLRALPLMLDASPNTAVVVLSGFGKEQMGAAALGAGAAAYVQKGTSLLEIVDVLAGCLGIDTSSATAPAPLPAPAVPPVPLVPTGVQRPGGQVAADLYRQLIDQAITFGLAALSRDGRIQTWNAGAERITGFRADDVIGHELTILYSGTDEPERMGRRLLSEAETAARASESRWLVAADGARRWVEVALNRLQGAGGETSGFALELNDRTEDRRLEETQASLFAAVSHDLRTPITAIRAFSSLFAGATPQNQVTFAARIEANAEQLQRLVDGLFDYAKVRAGAVPIELKAIDLSEAVRQRALDISTVLEPFELHIAQGAFRARADRGALNRILDNLLGNAAKYSPPGSRISVDFDRVDDKVRFVVRDQGRGIAADDLPMIFGEFVRGRLARSDGGSGLGLASVRHLVTQLGGTVWIDSEVDVGTSVTVELAASVLQQDQVADRQRRK